MVYLIYIFTRYLYQCCKKRQLSKYLNKHILLNDIELNEKCSICLTSKEEKKNKKFGKLKCNHIFHIDCIKKWLIIKPNCPLCVLSIV